MLSVCSPQAESPPLDGMLSKEFRVLARAADRFSLPAHPLPRPISTTSPAAISAGRPTADATIPTQPRGMCDPSSAPSTAPFSTPPFYPDLSLYRGQREIRRRAPLGRAATQLRKRRRATSRRCTPRAQSTHPVIPPRLCAIAPRARQPLTPGGPRTANFSHGTRKCLFSSTFRGIMPNPDP